MLFRVKMEVLDTQDLEDCISIEWSNVRAGFYKNKDVWTSDVLNLGVSPKLLIQKVGSPYSWGVMHISHCLNSEGQASSIDQYDSAPLE